jgi:hypothetical protein
MAEQVLLGSKGSGGEREGDGAGGETEGEMTQTMYAQIYKILYS